MTRRSFLLRPERVAYFEANGWRAYYDRNWPRLLSLILRLCQEQFHIPFPVSLLAAYDITRASIAWVPVDHDIARVDMYYEKFYRLARQYSGLSFDPAQAGRLETAYNEVHRRLAGQTNKDEFIQVMVQLHSAIFGLSAEEARYSAECRVRANDTVDKITSKTSQNPEEDWARLEGLLEECYHSINETLVKRAKA